MHMCVCVCVCVCVCSVCVCVCVCVCAYVSVRERVRGGERSGSRMWLLGISDSTFTISGMCTHACECV